MREAASRREVKAKGLLLRTKATVVVLPFTANPIK